MFLLQGQSLREDGRGVPGAQGRGQDEPQRVEAEAVGGRTPAPGGETEVCQVLCPLEPSTWEAKAGEYYI